MDKRTKILLIVLGALIVIGGGVAGFLYMSAGDAIENMTAEAPETATVPAGQPVEAPPSQPAPEQQAETPAAAPVAGQPAEMPASNETAAPAEPAAQAQAPASPATQAPAAAEAPAPALAPCAVSLKATVNGKQVEYGTAEELIEESGMKDSEISVYAQKNLDDARKAVDDLKKSGAAAEAVDCAQKNLELAERLVFVMTTKHEQKQEVTVYTYSSLDKRDPFMSPLEIPKVYPPIPPNAPPIEKVPSESLSVKAIIWNEKGFRAMVFTSEDNRGYTVKVGDTIGNKKGKVDKITEKRVYIKELIPDIFGDIETRVIVLKLYKEAE